MTSAKAVKHSRLLSLLLAVITALTLLSGSIAIPLLCRPFYYVQISALNLPERTGLTQEEIRTAFDEMMDYCMGQTEEFSTGSLAWSESGKSHFTDVRGLFSLDLRLFLVCALLLAVLWILCRVSHWRCALLLGRGPSFWAGAGLGCAFLIIGGLAALDFNRAFTVFHAVFFPGKDNWLFDPRTDQIINFNWIFAPPHSDLNASCFSVAWTGTVTMPRTFDGCIGLSTQDSMRLYVDDELLIDGWGPGKNADQALDFHFEADRPYKVRIEFVNDGRGARVIFGYSEGREDIEAAAALAAESDVAILCLGDNEETSGENFDRTTLDLPGRQLALARAVWATGTPTVLVLQSGRPVSANWENDHLPAILEAWFPGEQGGAAVAETLFGDNAPGGRLPITFPRSVGQVPCHYARRPGGGKKYVEMDWMPLYPFGYGLSYTSFAYRDLTLSADTIRAGESVTVCVTVQNTGSRAGAAVPQLYVHDLVSSVVKPLRQLAGFARVELQPGESRTVRFTVGTRALRTLGADYVWRVEPGRFELELGDNAENILMKAGLTVTAAE